jgi:hypothetical protein
MCRPNARLTTARGRFKAHALNRAYEISVPVEIPARGVTWLVIE